MYLELLLWSLLVACSNQAVFTTPITFFICMSHKWCIFSKLKFNQTENQGAFVLNQTGFADFHAIVNLLALLSVITRHANLRRFWLDFHQCSFESQLNNTLRQFSIRMNTVGHLVIFITIQYVIAQDFALGKCADFSVIKNFDLEKVRKTTS